MASTVYIAEITDEDNKHDIIGVFTLMDKARLACKSTHNLWALKLGKDTDLIPVSGNDSHYAAYAKVGKNKVRVYRVRKARVR